MAPLDRLLELAHVWPSALTLGIGVALLLGGGHLLVEGAVDLARRFGVSTLLIGLTIVAFGTSAPELAFNVIAARNGNTALSFGNVVGSNIANIGLVLGLAALLSPLTVHGRVVRREMPQLILVTLAMIGLALWPATRIATPGGTAPGWGRTAGLALLGLFAGCTWAWFRMARSGRRDPLLADALQEASLRAPRAWPWASVLFLAGLGCLLLGGKLTEIGAVRIADGLGMSRTLIGLTIVAVATSLPEVVTSVVAARKGHADLAVGNVVGSNLFNLLLVLGVTSTIAPIPLPADSTTLGFAAGWWDLGAMLLLTLVLWPLCVTHDRRIVKREGLFLLLCYGAYVAWTVLRERGGVS